MWHDRMVDDGVEPSVRSLARVLAACAFTGRAADAEAWLLKMQVHGVVPDLSCYVSAVEACRKGHDVDRCARIFDKIKASGFTAHESMYTALAQLYARRGGAAEIEKLSG